VTGHAQNIDVNGSAGKPFPQPAGDRLAFALAELGDELRDAAGREMMRQTRDDPLLNLFSRGAAVTKSERVHG
jgi:hypothetical protein